jgi:hypothetical protein
LGHGTQNKKLSGKQTPWRVPLIGPKQLILGVVAVRHKVHQEESPERPQGRSVARCRRDSRVESCSSWACSFPASFDSSWCSRKPVPIAVISRIGTSPVYEPNQRRYHGTDSYSTRSCKRWRSSRSASSCSRSLSRSSSTVVCVCSVSSGRPSRHPSSRMRWWTTLRCSLPQTVLQLRNRWLVPQSWELPVGWCTARWWGMWWRPFSS